MENQFGMGKRSCMKKFRHAKEAAAARMWLVRKEQDHEAKCTLGTEEGKNIWIGGDSS
jgi:hypothetical protein